MKIVKTEDVDFSKSLMFYGTVKSIEEKEYGQIKIIFEPRDYHGQLFEDVYILADPEEPSDDSLLADLLESTAWYQELEYDENNELEFSIEDLRKNILGIEVCLRIGFAGGNGIVLGISSCVGNLYGWGFLPESPIGPVRFITASEEPQSFIIFDEELCEAMMEE